MTRFRCRRSQDLGYQPFWDKWMNKWSGQNNKFETLIECLNENFQKYVHPLIKLIYDGEDGEEIGQPLQFELPRTNLNLVEQLTRLLDSMLGDEEPTQDPDKLEFIYIFSLIWSFGACLKQDSRKKFEDVLRKLSGRVFPPTPLFDNYYDQEGRNFINWEKLVTEYIPPPGKAARAGCFSLCLVFASATASALCLLALPCVCCLCLVFASACRLLFGGSR